MTVFQLLLLSSFALFLTAARESAKATGKTLVRPRTDIEKLEQAKILYENSDKRAKEVCNIFGFGRRTLFNYLSEKKNKF